MQILFQFDLRTIALFVALTFFIQAMAIGAQAFLIRELKQYRGVEAALLANLCVAVGLLLRMFAALLPEFLTTIVSNILLLVGPALFYVALSQFTGFKYSRILVVGVITIVLFRAHMRGRANDPGAGQPGSPLCEFGDPKIGDISVVVFIKEDIARF